MSQTRRSGPATGRPDNTDTPILAPDLPVVHGVEYGPCKGRAQAWLVVTDCAWCPSTHFHRNPHNSHRLRRSCPTTGRPFILLPRVARLRGGRRG